MKDHLSRGEIRKDAVQSSVQAAATAAGQVSSILTAALRDLAGALGGFATEIFEIRESARRASADQRAEQAGRAEADAPPPAPGGPLV